MRATCNHDYKHFLLDEFKFPNKFSVETARDDPNWTEQFLESFAKPNPKYYVDHDYPGWLVWDKELPAYETNPKDDPNYYDELESNARKIIGSRMTREWFHGFFAYLKQEPREGTPDRFRMASSMLLQFAFDLVRANITVASLDDIKAETAEVLGDGSDKHQHRATAEILGAYVCSYGEASIDARTSMWAYVFPIIKKIFDDGLTPENCSYWSSFVHLVLVSILIPRVHLYLLIGNEARERSAQVVAFSRVAFVVQTRP